MRTAPLRIVLLGLLAACAYGVVHDQITVRLCVEYFTVAHPPLFHTKSPTLLGLCWGVAATAPIGLTLGMLLALAAREGPAAPWPPARVARSVLRLLAIMAAGAFGAGSLGYVLSRREWVTIPVDFAILLPESQYHRFMAVWFAHGASYAVGLIGGGTLCYRIWSARGRPAVVSLWPKTPVEALRAGMILTCGAILLWIRFGSR